MYNLWNERDGTTSKVNTISCNLEYSLSIYQQNGNDIMDNSNISNDNNNNGSNNDNNNSYSIKIVNETTDMTYFIPQKAIRIFISPLLLCSFNIKII